MRNSNAKTKGDIHNPQGVERHPLPGDTNPTGEGHKGIPDSTSAEMNEKIRSASLKEKEKQAVPYGPGKKKP